MVSVAVPSTCIGGQTCSSLQQATYVLHEIARACTLFGVEEIVVYDVPAAPTSDGNMPQKKRLDSVQESYSPSWEAVVCANLLQYFVTPKHLRKLVFGSSASSKIYHYAQKLPRLPGLPDTVQGIAVRKRVEKKSKKTKKQKTDAKLTPYINLGFHRVFKLSDTQVPVNSRVQVDLKARQPVTGVNEKHPYVVRAVPHFSCIFTETAIPDGYTHTIFFGAQQFKSSAAPVLPDIEAGSLKAPARPLLLFGRWQEVEDTVRADPELGIDASALFDGKFETPANARLEDVVIISLARLC